MLRLVGISTPGMELMPAGAVFHWRNGRVQLFRLRRCVFFIRTFEMDGVFSYNIGASGHPLKGVP